MDRRCDWTTLLLPLTALIPAVAMARWGIGALADLPYLTAPLYGCFLLALALGLSRPAAFGLAALLTAGLWAGSANLPPALARATLVIDGVVLMVLGLAPHQQRGGTRRTWARWLVVFNLALVSGLLTVVAPRPPAAGVAPQRPLFFIPLEVDPSGERLMLFSLRDQDNGEEDTFTLWSLGLGDGRLNQVFRGYPLFLTDYSPDGRQTAFLASEHSWEEAAVPFGVMAAPVGGGQARHLLRPPVEDKTWLYPLWSKQGEQVAAWLLPGSGPGLSSDLPRSFVVPAAGGQPQPVQVRGCQLALLGAWQTDQPGSFVMTERGIFRVGLDGKSRRLVPTGEAPVEPFPFVIPTGVAPSGQHLAYLQLVFRGGEIERFHLGLVDMHGRRREAIRDLYPVAFGWSPDGKRLAGCQVDSAGRVRVVVLEAESGRRWVIVTGLKLASRELPMRVQFSRDGRTLALDGQLVDEESWDIATLDLESGKTQLLAAARNHLAVGWRADDRLVVATLSSVATIGHDGSGYAPVYGQSASLADGRALGQAVHQLTDRMLRGADEVHAWLASRR